jgi:GntR family transcriptional regulator, carbon starvation induced regulator
MNDENEKLADKVLSQLKTDILNGEFKPGEKLVLGTLKKRYGAGGSPLRESLSQLLAEGLVTTENQRGFRVSPVSIDQLRDIYEARAHLESMIVGIAIEKGDDIWEAGIVAAAHRLFKYDNIRQLKEISIHEWEERHHDFHDSLVNGCASEILLGLRKSLYEKAARYRNLWLKENISQIDAFDANLSEHQALMKAVLARDKSTAQSSIRDHILVPVKIIEKTFL